MGTRNHVWVGFLFDEDEFVIGSYIRFRLFLGHTTKNIQFCLHFGAGMTTDFRGGVPSLVDDVSSVQMLVLRFTKEFIQPDSREVSSTNENT